MRFRNFILFALTLAVVAACGPTDRQKRILVFTKTAGYRHASIPDGVAAITALAAKNQAMVDTTSNAALFSDDNLRRYDAVVFLSTTGTVLSHFQKASFERYIQSGGGYVGVHAAADCEYFWPWYGKLVGAYFESHPEIQDATLLKGEPHASTDHLPAQWRRKDEWYNFKSSSLNPDVKVILSLDEKSYTGGKMGDKHPAAWYHEFDGGRAWYTTLGHTSESYQEEAFLTHLWKGIEYAMQGGKPNYAKAKTDLPPDDNRFTKKELADNLDEPIELTVLPDGNVLFVQRKGEVLYLDAKSQKVEQVAKLDVWTRHEDGLLGITHDPEFDRNRYVYLFYSPNIKESVQHISRFTFTGKELKDEKVLLKVPVQRDECCHSAGSLTFGPGGNLYIALGDNTNPFNSDGYAPIDQVAGRSAWDAQKSSANTMDLRGKILRIKPEPDGSYSIPEGNLFPKGSKDGRPEIYVMGCRNPYRISVDPITGALYWGDVGPDAGKDSVQGPRGHDEFNMARTPGYYGWPYFIGNNKPYAMRDFVNNVMGPKQDPNKPRNTSVNNTGAQLLPPARPALVYYPYAESEEFPYMEKGGRSAMAGPVYRFNAALPSTVKLPKFYDGATIMYEWMRNKFFAMRVNAAGQITSMDPMFSSLPLNRVIDMELAPDGSLYMLEYGSLWFSQNVDARLVKVEYSSDNRLPIAKASADVTIGAVPLKINFSSKGSFDYDPLDTLKYAWRIEDPYHVNSREANPTYTITKPGLYNVVLVVTDSKGNSSTSSVTVRAGNAVPDIQITTSNNSTFYWPGQQLTYAVQVNDKEDAAGTGVDPKRINTTLAYVPQGQDLTLVAQGHQENKAAISSPGQALIEGSDCKACHNPERKSIGPSWRMVADRYGNDPKALGMLARKVINGGAGNWGDHGMSAHPQLSIEDAKTMVDYILNYGAPAKPANALPSSGKTNLKAPAGAKPDEGSFVLTASYQDKGAPGAVPLIAEKQLILRPAILQGEAADKHKGVTMRQTSGGDTVPSRAQLKGNETWLMFKNIDLKGIKKLTYRYAAERAAQLVEFRLDSVQGPAIASTSPASTDAWSRFTTVTTSVKPTEGKHDLYVVLVLQDDPKNLNKKMLFALDWVRFLQ